ncbi:MAG: hypothetical protein H7832_06055 [Magnetococcus sp. DMHC-6]
MVSWGGVVGEELPFLPVRMLVQYCYYSRLVYLECIGGVRGASRSPAEVWRQSLQGVVFEFFFDFNATKQGDWGV